MKKMLKKKNRKGMFMKAVSVIGAILFLMIMIDVLSNLGDLSKSTTGRLVGGIFGSGTDADWDQDNDANGFISDIPGLKGDPCPCSKDNVVEEFGTPKLDYCVSDLYDSKAACDLANEAADPSKKQKKFIWGMSAVDNVEKCFYLAGACQDLRKNNPEFNNNLADKLTGKTP